MRMILGCCHTTLIIQNNISIKKSGTLVFGDILGGFWVLGGSPGVMGG